MNERIAAASSSWTCWYFERTNLDALRHCRVYSHLCLFKQFGGGGRSGTKFDVSWFFGRRNKEENRNKKKRK